MGTVVVDSSVLLGFLDPQDAHHAAATRALRACRDRNDHVIVPATVFAEILVGASRIGDEAVRTTESFVELVADQVCPADRDIARIAARLRVRHRALRLPDALLLATAQALGADRILTADKAWTRWDTRAELIGE